LALPKASGQKEKGGLGEMNFCPPALPREARHGVGTAPKIFAIAKNPKPAKIYSFLIEKIFVARPFNSKIFAGFGSRR